MLAYLFLWPWWVTFVLLALIVVGIALEAVETTDGLGFVLAGVSAFAVLFVGIFAITVSVGRHYDRINCRRFEETTGRPTRFVIYSIGSTACLTRSGKTWLPIEQVREFGNG